MKKVILENGLTVYLNKDIRRKNCIIELCTKFGGMHNNYTVDGQEYFNEDGIAHLIEHLLIEKSSFGNLFEIFTEKSMGRNGFTSNYRTVFYVDAINDTEFALKTLLKGINNPVFAPLELETVKEPIYREIEKCEDDYVRQIMIALRNNESNKYFRSVIGTKDNVQGFTYDEVMDAVKRIYTPSNQMIVVSGLFNEKKILQLIKESYDSLSFSSGVLSYPTEKEMLGFNEKELDVYASIGKTEMYFNRIKYDVSNLNDRERYHLCNLVATKFKLNFGNCSLFTTMLIGKGLISETPTILYSVENGVLIIKVCGRAKDIDEFNKYFTSSLELNHFDEKSFNLLKKSLLFDELREKSLFRESLKFINDICELGLDDIDRVKDINEMSYEEIKELKVDINNLCLAKVHGKN